MTLTQVNLKMAIKLSVCVIIIIILYLTPNCHVMLLLLLIMPEISATMHCGLEVWCGLGSTITPSPVIGAHVVNAY